MTKSHMQTKPAALGNFLNGLSVDRRAEIPKRRPPHARRLPHISAKQHTGHTVLIVLQKLKLVAKCKVKPWLHVK